MEEDSDEDEGGFISHPIEGSTDKLSPQKTKEDGSKPKKHVKFEFPDTHLKSDIKKTPETLFQEVDNSTLSTNKSDNVSIQTNEDSSDKLIPMDVSLPSKYFCLT